MKILAMETGGAQACFAAVEVDSNLQVVVGTARAVPQSRQVSRDIIRQIAAVLDEAKWTLDNIEAIAVGIGPGSWTGLRIGLTTAKTLAQTRELPLLGVPSFDAFAIVAPRDDKRFYWAIAPCRAGEIYYKTWQTRDGELILHSAERILTLQNAADALNFAALQDVTLLFSPEGQSALSQIKNLVPHLENFVEIAPATIAQNIALLAARRLQNGERDDALTLSPLYLAPSNAERNWAEKLARQK